MEQDENKDIDLEENNEEEANESNEEEDVDWKAEALKYKSMAKRYKVRAGEKTEKTEEKPQVNEELPKGGYNEEAIDLRLDGYSKDEVSFILKNGGRKALEDKDSLVSVALRTKREQSRAEDEASKAKDTSQMTGVEKKYTQEKLNSMSSDELSKILPHADPQ